MLKKTNEVWAARALDGPESEDPLIMVPRPSEDEVKDDASVSIDMRLGRWFLRPRQSRLAAQKVTNKNDSVNEIDERRLWRKYYVPYGNEFTVHPGAFVLGATFEWLRMPTNYSGLLTGLSSVGRTGLIIETASAVHPGFSGCLTLEITNLGEIPINIVPGMKICQLLMIETDNNEKKSQTQFRGYRRPVPSKLTLDQFATSIASTNLFE